MKQRSEDFFSPGFNMDAWCEEARLEFAPAIAAYEARTAESDPPTLDVDGVPFAVPWSQAGELFGTLIKQQGWFF